MSLKDKVLAITGKLSLPRKSITDIIESNGGTFSASISKKVTHLICANPNENSTKLDKAKEMGIQVVGEDFLTNLSSSESLPSNSALNTTNTRPNTTPNTTPNATSNTTPNTTSNTASNTTLTPSSSGTEKTNVVINGKKKAPLVKKEKKVSVKKPKVEPSLNTLPSNQQLPSQLESTEIATNVVHEFHIFIAKMTASNSNLEKAKIFKEFVSKASEDFVEILQAIYHKQSTFGITSKNVLKFEENKFEKNHHVKMSLLDFVRQLVDAEITGHDALKVAVSFLVDYPEYRETLLSIFDKDLKIRFGLKLVNTSIPDFVPVFNVSLGVAYNDKSKKHVETGDWFISKKLDGVRCITIIKIPCNDLTTGQKTISVDFYSRGGLKFKTLSKVEAEIKKNVQNMIPHLVTIPNVIVDIKNDDGTLISQELQVVLDGEMCVIKEDGGEDFRSIVSEIKKKNGTVNKPRYLVFDLLTLKEFNDETSTRLFSNRFEIMKQLFPSYQTDVKKYQIEQNIKNENNNNNDIIKLLPQLPFTEDMFAVMSLQAEQQGWEGLMLRKDDVYRGNRSNDLLKVKKFETEEYVVQDVVFGDVQIINEDSGLQENIETLVSVIINHTGLNNITNEMDMKVINVGSGFSQEERKRFYNNPELIKGKTISVQFFETMRSKDGKESLRFPTFKGLHGIKRVL